MSNEELRIGNFACFAVYSTEHAFSRAYKPLLDEVGLTYPQYLVMALLWEQDELTVTQICRRMFLEANTITPLLQRLEAAGLLKRVRNPHDRRQVWAVLTDEGRALEARAAELPRSITKATGQDWATLTRLTQELAALRDNLVRSMEREGDAADDRQEEETVQSG